MERIIEVLDGMGIYNRIEENEALVEFFTNTAEQDIPVKIKFDGTPEDFVEKFTEYAENYNVVEEVKFYVRIRGTWGVPRSIRKITDDCQEAKDTLMDIAKNLQAALKIEDASGWEKAKQRFPRSMPRPHSHGMIRILRSFITG